MNRYHATSGAIVVADPHTGQIIAFAEAGSFKNSESWKNRVFAPGSTIKPFIAAAAIDAGLSSAHKIYDCQEPYSIDGTQFTNGNPSFGKLQLSEAIEKSVNICLIKVAEETGTVILRKKFDEFGFETKTWWSEDKSEGLQLANAALGTTIPVNLETMAKAYAILANKGYSFPENSGTVISEVTSNSVTQMLVGAVEHGTGYRAHLAGASVAGKTGTLNESYGYSSLALFGGYVTTEAPRYVTFVVIENGYTLDADGNKQASGGALAAPVFHDVALRAVSLNSILFKN